MHLKPYFTGADLVTGNLEVTLAGPPYKGYPRFSSPDQLADALRDAGFRILVNANNHALDRGDNGLRRTIGQLRIRGILQTGTFTDPLSRDIHYPLLVEKNGILIALLNYTYSTNGLKVTPPSIVNMIDTAMIRLDLQKASLAEPDFIIVAMHWGKEYERLENDRQRELAQFLFTHGADAIIGSHPHVVQPIRGSGKGNLVAYSLGNFISNQRNRYRDGGIAFEMELVKRNGVTEVADHAFLPFWVYKPTTKQGTQFTLLPAAVDTGFISRIAMPEEDVRKMKRFLQDTREILAGRKEVEPVWME
jgi:poly-gamma-glutamate synthesis protein (capsule biosynthesis protein)